MAQKTILKPSVSTLVKAYGKDLTARGIYWDKLIVFGSHARGKASEWSDIDVCVISSRFSTDRFDNQRLLMHNRSREFLLIEPHPFQPGELIEKWDPLAAEIRTNGIEIATSTANEYLKY